MTTGSVLNRVFLCITMNIIDKYFLLAVFIKFNSSYAYVILTECLSEHVSFCIRGFFTFFTLYLQRISEESTSCGIYSIYRERQKLERRTLRIVRGLTQTTWARGWTGWPLGL